MPTHPIVTPPPDRYLQVNGINTRYWQMGECGSTVILLHGGNGSIEFWLYNIATLAKQHQVYAFDMVGDGELALLGADFQDWVVGAILVLTLNFNQDF